MAESAVQFFAPDHPQLARRLQHRLEECVKKYVTDLAAGSSPDFASYRHIVGIIAGLTEASTICDQLGKELSR